MIGRGGMNNKKYCVQIFLCLLTFAAHGMQDKENKIDELIKSRGPILCQLDSLKAEDDKTAEQKAAEMQLIRRCLSRPIPEEIRCNIARYSLAKYVLLRTFTHGHSVKQIKFYSNTLLGAISTEAIKTWDISTNKLKSQQKGPNQMGTIVCSPDNTYTAFINSNNIFLRPEIGQVVQLNEHSGHVEVVKFSPDSKFLVSGSSDKTIKLWNISNKQCAHTFEGHGGSIKALAFSHDGKILVSGSDNAMIMVWNMDDLTCTYKIKGHDAAISSLAFSPDGKQLASGSADGMVRVWNERKLNELNEPYPSFLYELELRGLMNEEEINHEAN